MTRFSGSWIRRLRNLIFDLKAGGSLHGKVATRHVAHGAADVSNTDITALERIFDGRIRDTDVLVDVGCGKGRVIQWWLRKGVTSRIIGLELDEEVAEATRQRLRDQPNVTILTGDAVANLPAEGSLFYAYNPFNEKVVRAVSERLKELRPAGGDLRIIYYNPSHAEVFRSDPAWRVADVSIGDEGFHDLCVIEPAGPR